LDFEKKIVLKFVEIYEVTLVPLRPFLEIGELSLSIPLEENKISFK
jgi:hypothetical protein